MEEKDNNKGRFSGLVGKTEKPKLTGSTVAAFVCAICAAAFCWMPVLYYALIIVPGVFVLLALIMDKSDCDMRMWTKIIAIAAAAVAVLCFMFTFTDAPPTEAFVATAVKSIG